MTMISNTLINRKNNNLFHWLAPTVAATQKFRQQPLLGGGAMTRSCHNAHRDDNDTKIASLLASPRSCSNPKVSTAAPRGDDTSCNALLG